MKEKRNSILMGACALLLVICLFAMNGLRKEIESLRSTMISQYSSLTGAVNSIYGSLSSMLSEQASIVASFDYSIGEPDMETFSFPVEIRALPKAHSPGATAAYFIWEGREYPMEYGDGAYSLSLSCPIGKTVEGRLAFETDGLRETEAAACSMDPTCEALPRLYAYLELGGGTIQHPPGEAAKYSLDSQLRMDVSGYCLPFQEAEAYWELNGQRHSLGSLPLPQGDGSSAMASLALETELPPGSQFMVYVEAVDTYGFLHRVILEQLESDENGSVDWVDNGYGGEDLVHSPQGELLLTLY